MAGWVIDSEADCDVHSPFMIRATRDWGEFRLCCTCCKYGVGDRDGGRKLTSNGIRSENDLARGASTKACYYKTRSQLINETDGTNL